MTPSRNLGKLLGELYTEFQLEMMKNKLDQKKMRWWNTINSDGYKNNDYAAIVKSNYFQLNNMYESDM